MTGSELIWVGKWELSTEKALEGDGAIETAHGDSSGRDKLIVCVRWIAISGVVTLLGVILSRRRRRNSESSTSDHMALDVLL